MSASYYRERTNFYPPTIQSTVPSTTHSPNHSVVAQPDDHVSPNHPVQTNTPATPQAGPPRYCTVKGCTVILLPDYLHKMCEACRGRHRAYAMTKRAKRKAEKAALGMQGGQPVVWMPQDDAVKDDEGDRREGSQTSQHEEVPQRPDATIANRYPPNAWDRRAIDPALFSQESALAGALTLPGSSTQHVRGQPHAGSQDPSLAQEAPMASGSTPLANNSSTVNFQTGMQLPLASLSPAIFDRPSAERDSSAPQRMCSIKGCKALVSGSSFFKMCEPCRDRYRNYGITKRAKWKHEKQIAVAELQKTREEEDQRRAEVGLPPLPKQDDPEWQDYQTDETSDQPPEYVIATAGPSASRPSRMCTVSHCRELLPPDYQYLRCDRHRLQNRHHSKLKRVRDKEVKAAAFNHWVVSVGGHKSEATPGPDNGPDPEEEHGRSYDQEGTPGTGFPPAARGMRRTNHVCIIKACFNLLSPTNPWRMCDVCRARDRAHRREKALRGNGTITSPPPDEGEGANQEQGEESEKVKKPKKKKKKKKPVGPATVAQDGIVSADATAAVPQPPEASAQQSELQGTGLVFMSPLLPSQPSSPPPQEPSMQASGIDPTPADAAPSMASPHTAPVSSAPFQIVSAEEIASKAAQAESAAAPPRKKRKVKGPAASAPGPVRANAQASSSSTPSVHPVPPPVHPLPPAHEYPLVLPPPPPPPPPFSADAPPPPHGAPYPPYYMSPYGMQPYGGQPPPYPYSHYGPHFHQYPPPYGYQPPYAPYSQPYPYPPPYVPAPYPAGGPPPPPPPQPPPPVQGTYSVSSDFVSRADYAAASQSVQQRQTHGAAPHYATFSAKTGEPHNRVSSVPSALRKKRPLEGEGVFYAGEHAPSSSGQSTPASAPPPVAAAASGEASSDGPGDRDGPPVGAVVTAVCSNQKCHRPLPAHHSGSLCARCRERLKKRSEKAKHRFKLEPRKLIGKPDVGAARVDSTTADG